VSRKITIEFLGDSKHLDRTMGGIEGKSSKIGGALKKVGKVGALGFAVAGVAAVKFGADSVQSLARIETINAQTTSAIKSTGGAAGVTAKDVEKLAGRIETMTASEAEAVQEGANLLLTFTNVRNEAGKGNKVFDQATSVMNDMSVAMGTDMKSSAMLVGKALNDPVKGVTALTRAGVQLTDGQKETIKSLVESGDTMGAQKIILGELTKQFGGSGEAFAQTAQGKFELVKHKLGEIGETIFTGLMPALTRMADWALKDGLPAFERFGTWLSENLPPIWDRIKTVVETVMGALEGDIGGGLGRIQQIFTDVVSIVTSLWDTFGSTILTYASTTLENLKQVFGGALDVISGIFATFSALLKGDWSGAWDGIKQILSGAWEIIKGLVKQGLNVLSTAMSVGWTVLKGIVGLAWDGIKTLVSAGIDKVVEWVKGIPGKFSSALSSLKSTAGELFRDAMDAGKEKVTSIGQTIIGWIADIPGKLREKLSNFKDAGAALIGGFVDGMKNAAGVIEGIAGNVWSAVKSLLNGAIDKINAALEFTISLPGPDITVNPGNIPHLAKGGLVTRPTLALIGEDGPEAVVPLSRKHNPGGTMPGMGGGGGGAPIVVQLMLPGGKVIEQLLIQHTRDSGRPLQVSTLGPA
jgi:phage-related protein